MLGTHEFHENWATTNSNDSTVFIDITILFKDLAWLKDCFTSMTAGASFWNKDTLY